MDNSNVSRSSESVKRKPLFLAAPAPASAQASPQIAPIGLEDRLIAAALRYPKILDRVEDYDFQSVAHREAAAVIRGMPAGQILDAHSLAALLEIEGKSASRLLESLHRIEAEGGVDEPVAEGYARTVVQLAESRKRARLGKELSDGPHNIAEIRAALEASERRLADAPEPIEGQAAVALLRELFARRDAGEELVVTTGIAPFDQKLNGGLGAGQLAIIGARTGQGKSTIGMQCAFSASQHHRVLYISNEMTSEELNERLIALITEGRVTTSLLKRPKDIPIELRPELERALGVLARSRLAVIPPKTMNLPALSSAIRKAHARGDLGLVVVDYIQKAVQEDPGEPRHVAIAKVSGGLKELALELKIPIILLAQLGRDIEKRACKRPLVSDLRECGDLEQDADVVALIGDPDDVDPDASELGTSTRRVLYVLKVRGGQPGNIPLEFRGHESRFVPESVASVVESLHDRYSPPQNRVVDLVDPVEAAEPPSSSKARRWDPAHGPTSKSSRKKASPSQRSLLDE